MDDSGDSKSKKVKRESTGKRRISPAECGNKKIPGNIIGKGNLK
jgi:hypothetical protein